MNIGFLHLSDMHIRDDNDISQTHIKKLLDSFNTYKKEQINELVIIISGDITFSGNTMEFDCAYNVIENLIGKLKCKLRLANCNLIIVPGNHDVCHNGNTLSVNLLKEKKYDMAEEDKKLHNFYDFCKRFDKPDFKVYSCFETIDIQGFKINVNMVNNAIYSTTDEYKGLLYIDDDNMKNMECLAQKGFTITVMHHSPDYYRDEIKNSFEQKVVSNSSIVFLGHEHNNIYKLSSIDGKSNTIIQAGGSLINNGSWDNSSYCIGVLNSNSLKYSYSRFTWNKDSKQYEREKEMANTMNKNVDIEFSEDFKEFLDKMDKNYYVFPSLLCKKANEKKSLKIREYDPFINEIEENVGIIISGSSNSGKTALMHRLFSTLLEKDYMVLFCSAEIIVSASNNKKQNPQKLIDFVFNNNYGANKSLKQKFEQSDIHKCIFMFDDFDQVKDINLSSFIDQLKIYFGKIILSTNKSLDFDFRNISLDFLEEITKLEIEPLVGTKRKELIRQIVLDKSIDKSEKVINQITIQIDASIKSLVNLIPPQPYYITQICEMYMNNIGEITNNSSSVFSKVFESNITVKVNNALRNQHLQLSVELIYEILGKIAYFIHFNKAYPISRRQIDNIVQKYIDEFGTLLTTEDLINVSKTAKILIHQPNDSETYRFENKTVLAYFVAKEIVSKHKETGSIKDIEDIICKCCFNICTDVLLFIIYQTDDVSILRNMLQFISEVISGDNRWNQFSIESNMPDYLKSIQTIDIETHKINVADERNTIEKTQESSEELIVSDFNITDLYDWDEDSLDKDINKIIRMQSLLHILSKSLPCFEHKLKLDLKKQVVNSLYCLPNSIFMFWANAADENYTTIIEDLKMIPYIKDHSSNDKQKTQKAKQLFHIYSLHFLLNLYYIPVLNAVNPSTLSYLTNTEYFDFSESATHQLQNLMFVERDERNANFIKNSLKLQKDLTNPIAKFLLLNIVRHGIITRNDTKENVDILFSKFKFSVSPETKRAILIEKAKEKNLNK